jgi:hypothetical protein
MTKHQAACSCGKLSLTAEGDPIRISICHCLACQRRTGSAFGIQARFPREKVSVTGSAKEFVRVGDEGHRITFRFCPECGATVYYQFDEAPETIAVPVGAFADPTFPPPRVSVYGTRRHPWVCEPEGIEHFD